jgi:hypothetical protein
MQWFRNFLSSSRQRSPKAARPSAFRPSLETLDQRDLPSVSSVLTASGLTQFIVDNTNSLIVKSTTLGTGTVIAGTATTGVRTAQGFRTADGNIGFDAVMMDGSWVHRELGAGGALLPNGTYTSASITGLPAGSKILDVGTAYDSNGKLRLDILVTKTGSTSTSLDVTGRLFEFNQASGGGVTEVTALSNVRWVSTYIDAIGGTGIAIGQTFGQELLVRKGDNTGVATLYDGLDTSPAAITEYTQTVSPITSTGALPGFPGSGTTNAASRKIVIDVTYNSDTSIMATMPGTYAIEYSVTPSPNAAPVVSVMGVGVDNTIKPGG